VGESEVKNDCPGRCWTTVVPEWRVALFLSQDTVGLKELMEGIDLHTANQERFKLPSRLIAKTYLFRLLYGGSAYSYANDPDFNTVSKSEKFWEKVIEATYEKYQGLGRWHKKLVQTAIETGKIETPFGRQFVYQDPMKERTKILNYTVNLAAFC
jgi:DNA polymerase I-like protein with 3'-5' exonuclease and polymerase domains